MGTFSNKSLLKLVYFVVKSSCHNSQIKYFLKSAAPDWAPPPNERRIGSSENLKSAAALKRVNTIFSYRVHLKFDVSVL
jgi:hypothetical protein